MNWRIGLGLIFLLILLFAVLHMAMYVIPPVHNGGQVFQDVSGTDMNTSAVGQVSNSLNDLNALNKVPDHWSTIEAGEDVSVYPNGMQYDISGNLYYPFVSPSKF